MTSLNKFIDPDLSAADVLHSSGYVSASGIGGGMGGLSMEKRQQLLNKPRVVGSYRDSHLGRRYGAVKARTNAQKTGRVYDASSDSFNDKATFSNRQHGGLKDQNKIDVSIEKRQHFIEPSSRPKPTGYNPFA